MAIPYIIKLSHNPNKTGRKIVVFDKQPYYQSTGRNSHCPFIWFPFVMIKEDRPINELKIPPMYKPNFFPINAKQGYIVKVLRKYLKEEVNKLCYDRKDRIIKKRNPLKSTLITAARLSGPLFPEATLINVKLSELELILAHTPLILEDKPEFSSCDPIKINNWLMSHGAPRIISEAKAPNDKLIKLHTKRKRCDEDDQLIDHEKKYSKLRY